MTGPAGQGSPGRRFGGDLLTQVFATALDPGYAAAARRRARDPGPPPAVAGVRRTGRIVALILLGFLLAVAYHQVVVHRPAQNQAHDRLIGDVRRTQQETDRLQRQADQLRDDVAGLRDQAVADAGGDAAGLRDLEADTGLARVHGAGIVVVVGDAASHTDPVTGKTTADPSGRVYDRDLQQIVNALWSAGAEAVEVGGQRLTGTSTIRAAGGAILVDFRPVSSPYRIRAIGPGDLDRRFARTDTARAFSSYVDQYGMTFSVRKDGDMTLAAAADPQLRYARPVPAPSTPASPR